MQDPIATIVIPTAGKKECLLDTLDSVEHYCQEPHEVVIIDDHTCDGSFAAITEARKPNWHLLRNPKNLGISGLAHSLMIAYRYLLANLSTPLVLRLDVDALLIQEGVLTDAKAYADAHRDVGIFGVYSVDYNRPRSYQDHRHLIDCYLALRGRLRRGTPPWAEFLRMAEKRGYDRGDNVFGGACFLTLECLHGMEKIGALDLDFDWYDKMLMEDVYYSFCAVAAGFRMGHFAAPDGPLCLEHKGLPYKAHELIEKGFKLVHSVDQGKNTHVEDNGGLTARQYFRKVRHECGNRNAHG